MIHVTNDGSLSDIDVSQIIPYYVHFRYSQVHWKCLNGLVPTIEKVMKNSKHPQAQTLLQYRMRLAAGQTCELVIPFDKQLLR